MEGSKIIVEGGHLGERQEIGSPTGTSITVRDLFFNTPARYKFLKKDYTEAGYIEDVVTRLALGYPEISFKLINAGSLAVQTPGNNDVLSCAYTIFGSNAKITVPLNYEEGGIKVIGLAGKPEIARSNRSQEIFFINNRYIKNKTISTAVEEAYNTLIPSGKYPFIILNINLDPQFVDVNVHPTKQEVRFSDESLIFRVVYHALKNALFSGVNLVPEIKSEEQSKKIYGMGETMKEKNFKTYEQENLLDVSRKNSESIFKPSLNRTDYGNNYDKNIFKKDFCIGSEKNDILACPKDKEINYKQSDYKRLEENHSINEEQEKFVSFKIIGTAFSTFVIIEWNDELYIIDQHAAHERVMYERLKKDWENSKLMSQMLLIPEVVELTHKEFDCIEQNNEILSGLGIIVEQFGNNSIKINSVPLIWDKVNIRETFLDVLDGLNEYSKSRDEKAIDAFLYRMACKAAVKANTCLSKEEISALMNSMMTLNNPFTCPHGRPTAIKMTKREIEKKFGRT